MGHARSIYFVFIPLSLFLALLLCEPDLLCILIYYIYAECKVSEKISENGGKMHGFLSRVLVFDAICGLFSCGLA